VQISASYIAEIFAFKNQLSAVNDYRGVAIITTGDSFFNSSNLSSWEALYTFR